MCKINQKNKTHKQKKNRQRATACFIENEMSNVDVGPRTYFNYQVNHNILIQINIWFYFTSKWSTDFEKCDLYASIYGMFFDSQTLLICVKKICIKLQFITF